ncbi:MAG TPA: replication-associated recombination protein A [Candidatus Hypogeohydataceae bacterium YC38]|nr:replication-associated recombination protein A [Candidatus Brocadiales bacterium]
MELFSFTKVEEKIDPNAPLALRMRPRKIEDFAGQVHFFGPDKLLRRMLKADKLSSVLFYGPPGTGKTALAHVIAYTTQAHFEDLNAASSNIKDVRRILREAKERALRLKQRTILFVDELHHFNRTQQDILLPDVEKGTVILIGATVHNPFFAINSPLVSRSQIFQFEPLSKEDVKLILRKALTDKERGLGNLHVEIDEEALDHLAEMSEGDARRALNALEVGVLSIKPDSKGILHYSLGVAEESIQRKAIVYDKEGDAHYDAASAFIKSMRGGDPDAALYWMAKMLEAGEDPRFIARRIVILAAEDVGNADPMALVLANAALGVSEFVGLPEARIPLAQAVTYVACAPKSNASYLAIEKALEDVRKERTQPVPKHLKDTNYPGAAKLGHGEGYKYPHNYPGQWIEQEYLPSCRPYYEPKGIGLEAEIKERLEKWRRKVPSSPEKDSVQKDVK